MSKKTQYYRSPRVSEVVVSPWVHIINIFSAITNNSKYTVTLCCDSKNSTTTSDTLIVHQLLTAANNTTTPNTTVCWRQVRRYSYVLATTNYSAFVYEGESESFCRLRCPTDSKAANLLITVVVYFRGFIRLQRTTNPKLSVKLRWRRHQKFSTVLTKQRIATQSSPQGEVATNVAQLVRQQNLVVAAAVKIRPTWRGCCCCRGRGCELHAIVLTLHISIGHRVNTVVRGAGGVCRTDTQVSACTFSIHFGHCIVPISGIKFYSVPTFSGRMHATISNPSKNGWKK